MILDEYMRVLATNQDVSRIRSDKRTKLDKNQRGEETKRNVCVL